MKTRELCPCGEAAVGFVWEVAVCAACNHDWHQDERFSTGSINAALKQPDDPTRIGDYEVHHRAYCAEATRRTREWADARRVVVGDKPAPVEAPARHTRDPLRGKR